MTAYYNENDPFAAAWLRELIKAGLIADGEVDERDIRDVRGDDVRGFTQCHFFAGIGGWSYALRLAGWDDARPVWTGSCPCQPFSAAGRGHGEQDERHLWPIWFSLITEHRPASIFGEQVAGLDALSWFDAVSLDLESKSYAVAAADLCAASVGQPHNRSRLFWLADSDGQGRQGHPYGQRSGANGSRRLCSASDMRQIIDAPFQPGEGWPQPIIRFMDDGVSRRLAKASLRGYGNAIVPQVAAAFVSAYLECAR